MNPSPFPQESLISDPPDWADMQHEQLESWLRSLPEDYPVDSAYALTRQIVALRKADLAVRTQLKLLDQLREKGESLLPLIESQLNQAPLPLPTVLQRSVVAANALLKELAANYTTIAATLSGRWYVMGSSKPLRDVIIYWLRLNLRRLNLAYRIYARGSRSAWTSLHRLYGIAQVAGLATQGSECQVHTAEQLYIKGLLLAFAEPARLARGDLDQVRFYLDRFGSLARLEPALAMQDSKSRAAFLVRPSEARPGQSLLKRRDGELHADDRILYCAPLVEKLLSQIDGLGRDVLPGRLGLPKVAGEGRYLTLLRSLAQCWSAPATRRYTRTRFHARVDAVVGFSKLWRFLGGGAYQRRSDDTVARSAPSEDVTEWTVSNESPDGFALRFVSGNTSEIRVGEIVAIRPRDNAAVHVCIARRAATAFASLELGVQVLASRAMAATIDLPAGNPPGTVTRRLVRVIFLPHLPAIGNAPALIAAPDSVSAGMEFAAVHRGRHTMLRIETSIEKTPSCEVFSLEISPTNDVAGTPPDDPPPLVAP